MCDWEAFKSTGKCRHSTYFKEKLNLKREKEDVQWLGCSSPAPEQRPIKEFWTGAQTLYLDI